jgi:tetratricopeptide (TPR) repeat protein
MITRHATPSLATTTHAVLSHAVTTLAALFAAVSIGTMLPSVVAAQGATSMAGSVVVSLLGQAPTDGDATQPSASATANQLAQQAYQLTKSADSLAEYTRIIDLCRQARESKPSEKIDVYAKQLMAWAHNRRGESLADEGNQDKALEDFEEAISLDPTRWAAWHNRGVSFAIQKRYDEAISDFRRTIKLKPNYATARFNLGELLYETGSIPAAIDSYNEALRLKPDDATAYNSRGHAYFVQATKQQDARRQRQDYTNAIRDYTKAIQIDPEFAAAYTNRGDTYYDLGDFERTAQDYRAAVRLDPNLGRAYQSAAWLMATCPNPRYRDENLAVQAAEKAISLDGDQDFSYLDTLAAAYANAGDFEKAAETQSRVIEMLAEEDAGPFRLRLELYQESKPYRTPLGSGAAETSSNTGQ